jgi:hypothetical protein
MTRYAEYIRVSGASQAERKTHTIQQSALERMRERRPGTLVPGNGPTGAFEDLAVSGALAESERPQWARVMELVRSRKIDELRIHAFDRLIRSDQPAAWGQLTQDFQDSDTVVVETSGAVFDLRGKNSFEAMMFIFRAMGAGDERARIAKRFIDGRRNAAGAQNRRGGWGAIPFGYRHEPGVGYLLDHRDLGGGWTPVGVVARVFELAKVLSKDQICARLDAEEVPTPRGIRRWSRATIGGWLTTTAYKGRLTGRLPAEVDDRGRQREPPPGVRVVDGRWEYTVEVEPIVSVEDWESVRKAAAGRRTQRDDDFVEFEALFRYYAYCGTCGARMQAVNAKVRGARYPRYRCFNRSCPARKGHAIPAVDAAAWQVIEDRLCSPELLAAGLRSDEGSDIVWADAAAGAAGAIARLESEIGDLLAEFGCASATVRAAVSRRIGEIEESIQLRREDLARAERAIAQQAEFERRWTEVQDQVAGWAATIRGGLSYEQRREIVKGLFGPGGGRITLHSSGRIEVLCDVLAVSGPVAPRSSTRSRAGSRGTGCSSTKTGRPASRCARGSTACRPRTPPPRRPAAPRATPPSAGRSATTGSRRV